MRAGDDKLPGVADGQGPNLAVVTIELLDVFELEE